MATNSKIEWTETTWNPVTGCTKISQGCKHCYAEVMAKRLLRMRQSRYRNGFKVTLQEDIVEAPLKWRKPKIVFVNSMSDLFHKDIPSTYIKRVFQTMNRAGHHTFQVLTKRADRLEQLSPELTWTDNIWMGVSVEDVKATHRIPHLLNSGAKTKFLSVEPLLESIPELPINGIDWVIVGGESGHRPRPVDPTWVRDIRDRCLQSNVPFFFKQWGGRNKKKAGRILDGQTWDQMPIPVARRVQVSLLDAIPAK